MLSSVEILISRPAAVPCRLPGPRRAPHAFTLVEVMIAAIVMAMVCGGILATIIQSRRLTEGSIVQNSINTVMQGYIEQTKSMEYADLAPSLAAAPSTPVTIPTVLDSTTPDALTLSWGSPPTSLPPIGTTPTGAVDNVKSIAIERPAVNPNDTINLVIWVWVQDLTDIPHNVGGAKAVTMIYTYRFQDGGRVRYIRNSLRTIRSVVPSF